MKPFPEEREGSSLRNVLVWLALITLAGANFLIGLLADIGKAKLPALIGVSVVEMTIGLIYFMRLDEQKGARRAAFPVGLAFVVLLGLIALLDVITRWAPTRPDGPTQPKLPPEIEDRLGPDTPPPPIPMRVRGGLP